MKLSITPIHGALGLALVLLSAGCEASHSHRHLHQHYENQHTHLHVRHTDQAAEPSIEKRSTCAFPGDEDPNLVAVTPDKKNAGWAMSPDQECTKDSYCPYACKPGMVMAQWDPDSTYDYPSSMNGGLYCDKNGEIKKPFSNKPYCVDGTGTVKAVNKAGKEMSWCQTVLPGNEAMLIPTIVSDMATIAVPDTSYWCETAAHFYINPPGSSEQDCVWGDDTKSIGNWSPFVAGANTDSDGNTFVKLGWNPIYESSVLKSRKIDFGVKVECPDGGCNGLPCGIDPSKGGGLVDSLLSASGAGDSDFCVVTVPKGSTAHIVAYTPGGVNSDDDDVEEDEPVDDVVEEKTTTSQAPTTTQEPTTSQAPTSSPELPTTTEEPTTTSTAISSVLPSTTSTSTSTTVSKPDAKPKLNPTIHGGIYHENTNDTSSETGDSASTPSGAETTSKTDEKPATATAEDVAGRQSSPTIAGLLVAFVAAACFF